MKKRGGNRKKEEERCAWCGARMPERGGLFTLAADGESKDLIELYWCSQACFFAGLDEMFGDQVSELN